MYNALISKVAKILTPKVPSYAHLGKLSCRDPVSAYKFASLYADIVDVWSRCISNIRYSCRLEKSRSIYHVAHGAHEKGDSFHYTHFGPPCVHSPEKMGRWHPAVAGGRTKRPESFDQETSIRLLHGNLGKVSFMLHVSELIVYHSSDDVLGCADLRGQEG